MLVHLISSLFDFNLSFPLPFEDLVMAAVEGDFGHLRLAVPGRPVTANGVSTNGENASGTRENRRRSQIRMKEKVLVCDEN